MTTTLAKKRAPKRIATRARKPSRPEKPLRIREELLPDSARYITIDDIEYVAVPVADFGEWYEDTVDLAVAEDRDLDPAPPVPAEQVFAHLPKSLKAKK